jgi:two-component system, cell cycle sensor histidine kinase and response regulator CckA
MGSPLRLLMVEDSEDDAALLLRELRRGNYDVQHQRVDTASTMSSALDSQEWDLIISDYSMPQFSGLAALQLLRAKDTEIPFIFLSGTLGEETAVAALKGSAQDYLMKDNLARLVPAIQRELREAEERRERKRLEQQLQKAQKMEAIGQLAGGIAHDFNNLLGVIIGYSELILNRVEHDSETYKQAEEIMRAGERAGSLTRQLLAFSRKQMLEPRVLDLNTIVVEIEKMLRRLIGEDIDLKTLLDPTLNSVKADPGHIEQVIMNLAVNARDAMPHGGKLTIETSNLELDEIYARMHPPASPGRFVMLAVGDTGSGMDAKTIAHIFEPFFTTKEIGKGTGLGLATVYGIVNQSGGFIQVYSELGLGTVFKIYFPQVKGSPTDMPTHRKIDTTDYRGSETILLVEDAEPLRELMQTVLQSHGYVVLSAKDGSEALRVSDQQKGPIHLLLTDVVMPGINGNELSKRLKPTRAKMKVLYVSGYTNDAIVRHGILEHAVAILQKPFTQDAFLRKLREVLDEPDSRQDSFPGEERTGH